MLPKKIYLNYVDEDDEEKTWCVDPVYVEDCEMQNREYADLSQVWHNAKEEPKKGECILGEYQGGIYQTYLYGYVDCEWSSYVKVFSLIRWAYVNDLLPKGGEA